MLGREGGKEVRKEGGKEGGIERVWLQPPRP